MRSVKDRLTYWIQVCREFQQTISKNLRGKDNPEDRGQNQKALIYNKQLILVPV